MGKRKDLIINGLNARETWGIITTVNTFSQLMQPAPVKDYPVNQSRLENGARYDISNPKVAERSINLELQMIAPDEETFIERYNAFGTMLSNGLLDISSTHQPEVVYHCIYRSCAQYTQFRFGIATISLKLTEPNPADRTFK